MTLTRGHKGLLRIIFDFYLFPSLQFRDLLYSDWERTQGFTWEIFIGGKFFRGMQGLKGLKNCPNMQFLRSFVRLENMPHIPRLSLFVYLLTHLSKRGCFSY